MIHDTQLEKAVDVLPPCPFCGGAPEIVGQTAFCRSLSHQTFGLHLSEWCQRAAANPEVSDDDIIVLYQEGCSLAKIAQAVGTSTATVHARLKKHGLTKARRRIKWTANMRNELIGLRAIKAPMSTIAKRLKVSRSAIYAELKRMGREGV